METLDNPVLTQGAATGVQVVEKPIVQKRKQPTRTLESQPQSNRAAVSTPQEVNYLAAVKICAGHKVSEGESYVSRKGKSHLKALVCAAVASQLGLSKEDGQDLSQVRDGREILAKIDSAIVAFFGQLGSNIARDYDRLSVRTQFAFDRVKVGKDGSRAFSYGLAATMRGERDTRDVSESRRVLNVLLTKHQKRMDYMLEHKDDDHPMYPGMPRFTKGQLAEQSARIEDVKGEIAKLPEFKGAVAPDTQRDVAEMYRNQK